MPTQKDFKRLVRSRMQKTGESYTAARFQLLSKTRPKQARNSQSAQSSVGSIRAAASAVSAVASDLAEIAGMSDASLSKRTGRTWAEWVRILDAARAAEKPHREIAQYVSSLGTPDWWTQTVTVGYERIRGLRARGQRRDGAFEASKSRTFNVPVETLYDAFANTRRRKRWLPVAITVRSARAPKAMRIGWQDDTQVLIGFFPKGAAKSSVAIQHLKLPDKAAADAMKKTWAGHFDRLGELLA
jgi:hypothetical protein